MIIVVQDNKVMSCVFTLEEAVAKNVSRRDVEFYKMSGVDGSPSEDLLDALSTEYAFNTAETREWFIREHGVTFTTVPDFMVPKLMDLIKEGSTVELVDGSLCRVNVVHRDSDFMYKIDGEYVVRNVRLSWTSQGHYYNVSNPDKRDIAKVVKQ